ncbi:rhomboid family intramembrane serine protease [Salinarchaeum laminariae]|uniref:rhomboid family intramembrane serine protease n=1 Tax=Salinarchaeum laminariae TaxID=869888 RepID=UPI0020BE762D|nr:rhomboid family intramembrane serine protease [Salinarchaeum laminariae]
MAECDACGKSENMPYECKRCGGQFCTEHRLPESHDCPGLNAWSGGEGGGALGGGPSAGGPNAGQGPSASGGIGSIGTEDDSGVFDDPFGTGGWRGYFRNNMTFVFLVAMWLTFAAQLFLRLTNEGGIYGLEGKLFMVRTTSPENVWTYVTSIFAHSGIAHIAFNSIALYFFGPIVEKRIGSKRFTALFFGAGILASVGSVAVPLLLDEPMAGLGASGAILAILGVLTILNPDLRVLLFFAIPMPLWVLTIGYGVLSVFALGVGGPGAGGIGHVAHLSGLLIGLAYGQYLKEQGVTAPRKLQFGGGGGGGMGGGRRRF